MAADLTEEEYKRLVLANQYEILSRIAPDEAEWGQTLDRVVRGFPLGNAPHLELIREYIADPLTDDDREMVHNILDLYARIQQALAGTADETRTDFPGFDGNNETQAMAYMRLLREEDRWTFVKPEGKHALNSHCSTYSNYRRMISDWDSLGRPNELTPDQARKLLGLS